MNRRQPMGNAPAWDPAPAPPNVDGLAPPEQPGERHAVTSSDLERLRDDIAHTRQELGETIEALSARLDVKARARDGLRRARGRAAELTEPVRLPSPAAGAVLGAGIAAGLLLVAMLLRRRRSR